MSASLPTTLLEIGAEADRAHRVHGPNSMRVLEPLDPDRLAIIGEEYGELCREYNEARLVGNRPDPAKLRAELIQVAAMAADWANTISEHYV